MIRIDEYDVCEEAIKTLKENNIKCENKSYLISIPILKYDNLFTINNTYNFINFTDIDMTTAIFYIIGYEDLKSENVLSFDYPIYDGKASIKVYIKEA